MLSGGLVAAAAPARAAIADTSAAVPVTGFRDILLDEAHGHVFLAGGDSIVVRDMEGGAVTTIAEQPGASQLALSPDASQLYVALSGADAISVIDTASLTETKRYASGASTCPSSLAATSTRVWFGYGCPGGAADLGVLDPSGAGSVTLGTRPWGTFTSAPLLAQSPAQASLLAVADYGQSSATLSVIDVASGAPQLKASRPVQPTTDMTWTRDGTHVLTASTYNSYHASFLASDLSADGAYSGADHDYPSSVAAGPDGLVAAGLGWLGENLRVYESDGTLAYRFSFGRADQSSWLANRGLSYAADGTLFAVTHDDALTYRLRVIRSSPLAPTSIGLTPPYTKTVGKPLSIQGQVATYLDLPANSPITVQKQGVYGTLDLPTVYTRAGGAFTITDTPTKREQVTYTATFAGDAHHLPSSKSASFLVKGIAPAMTLGTSQTVYDYGQVFAVTVHLDRPPGALVNVYAQPYGGTKTLIQHALTDSNRNVYVNYSVNRKTTLSATFAGDETYEPAGATRYVTSRARLVSVLSGYYGTSGSYRLYKTSVDPVVRLTVQPSNPGALVSFGVETYYPPTRTWVRKASSAWVPTDGYSKASYKYVSSEPANVRFRIRAYFQHTTLNYDTTGPWVYGMFTT